MISVNYLLFALPPVFVDDKGGIWMDELWYRDLVKHFDYIEHLTLASEHRPKPADGQLEGIKLVQLTPYDLERVDFEPVHAAQSMKAAPLSLLRNIPRVWNLVRRADIVHSGAVGWPYPLGILINPLAKLLRKPMVIVIESSPWRLPENAIASRSQKIRETLNERFAKWSVKHADLAVFTSPGYLETLGKPKSDHLLITPANWVQHSDILDETKAAESWTKKSGPLKYICPTRLLTEKGIYIVLKALEHLDAQKSDVQLDIIGQGDLDHKVTERLAKLKHLSARFLPPVPYGDDFFSLIRTYDAVIAPTLGDEQPRVVFDAYAQALPVIASNTSGQAFLVDDGKTGFLYKSDSPEALAQTLSSKGKSREDLKNMGMRALNFAGQQTHDAMHERRRIELEKMLTRKGKL